MYATRLKPMPESAPYRAAEGSLFVYAIQAERFFKIGRTRDLEGRYLSIASSCPLLLVLRLRLELPKDDAERLEIEVHRTLRDYRVRREWFEVGFEAVREAYGTALRRAFWANPRSASPTESHLTWVPTTDRTVAGPRRQVPQETHLPLRTDQM